MRTGTNSITAGLQYLTPEAPAEIFPGGQATFPVSIGSNKCLQLRQGIWKGAWNQKLK